MELVIVRIYCNQLCNAGSSSVLLIGRLEPSLLFMLVLDMPFSYLRAGLISEATWFTTILAAFALCYNIFLYSVEYLYSAFSHYVYFQLLGNLKT